jgi:hypothetical protein
VGKEAASNEEAVRMFEAALASGNWSTDVLAETFALENVRRELRGKNLACWCPVGGPCHANSLLIIANAED